MKSSQYLILTALAIAVISSACSQRAPTIKLYQKDGIQFSYYSDWKIAKDAPIAANPGTRDINIEGPKHAVVILICLPPSADQTLESFAESVAQKRAAAIESKLSLGPLKPADVSKGTSETTTGMVAGKEQNGILQRFSVEMLGMQVPHVDVFYQLNGPRYKVLILSQVATDDMAATRSASELILNSLSVK